MKLILQSLSKSYGDRELFNRLHAEISPGMRLGVAGPNGSGKTTLFRIILDQEHPDAGEVIIQGAGRIGYVSQEIGQTDLALPLLSYVLDAVPSWAALWREWENCSGDRRAMERLSRKQEEMERDFGYNPEFLAQSILQGLGFPAEWQERTIQALSGGCHAGRKRHPSS
ncbi:MAG: ATP-binding cassette domain-containing protein [Desulfovibrionales bacterium]